MPPEYRLPERIVPPPPAREIDPLEGLQTWPGLIPMLWGARPEPYDPASGSPVGTGNLAGIVRGSTPAGEGLMNFVRKVWPSLGRKADSLPDIDLHYAERKIPSTHAQYVPRNYYGSDAPTPLTPGGMIELARNPVTGNSAPAGQSVQSLVHELLHSIYQHKDPNLRAVPPLTMDVADRIMEKAIQRGRMTPERSRQYGWLPYGMRHGALDAMSRNIVQSRIPSQDLVP